MAEVVWVLVNCNNTDEATRIGEAVLAARQASCFDVIRKELAKYFWPPKSGNVEERLQGALLILETLDERFDAVATLVRSRHGDELPFIGAVRVERVETSYREWIEGELKAP